MRLDVAPCPGITVQVVKASKGHFPQPFLISDGLKNCCKNTKFLNTTENLDIFFYESEDRRLKSLQENPEKQIMLLV